jgi:hypothetical protein
MQIGRVIRTFTEEPLMPMVPIEVPKRTEEPVKPAKQPVREPELVPAGR